MTSEVSHPTVAVLVELRRGQTWSHALHLLGQSLRCAACGGERWRVQMFCFDALSRNCIILRFFDILIRCFCFNMLIAGIWRIWSLEVQMSSASTRPWLPARGLLLWVQLWRQRDANQTQTLGWNMPPSRCRPFVYESKTLSQLFFCKKRIIACHVLMLVYQWANLPLDLTLWRWKRPLDNTCSNHALDSWLPHAPAATAKVTQNTEAASWVAWQCEPFAGSCTCTKDIWGYISYTWLSG